MTFSGDTQPLRRVPHEGIVYYKNYSGLAIQFAAAGGLVYRKALAAGTSKIIQRNGGSDLGAYYQAGSGHHRNGRDWP